MGSSLITSNVAAGSFICPEIARPYGTAISAISSSTGPVPVSFTGWLVSFATKSVDLYPPDPAASPTASRNHR